MGKAATRKTVGSDFRVGVLELLRYCWGPLNPHEVNQVDCAGELIAVVLFPVAAALTR